MPAPWIKQTSAADGRTPRPRGAAGCLSGLVFVRTGSMSTMTDDQLKTYISVYGGKETGSVSGKTNYVVVGSDPGQTKTNAAKAKGIPLISEQQFLDLVVKRSLDMGVAAQMTDYQSSLNPIEGQEEQLVDTTAKKTETKKDDDISVLEDPIPSESFLSKFRPKTTASILGNGSIIQALKDSIAHPSSSHFAYFVHGPTGTGKTLALELICKELDVRVVAVNSNMPRTKKDLQGYLHCIYSNSMLDALKVQKKTVVVIDEAESVDQGGLPFLNEFIKKLRETGNATPIVFVTNDSYSQKLKTIKSKCIEFQFKRTAKNLISKYLFDILRTMNVQIQSPQNLDVVTDRAQGDIRRCLQTLQMFVAGGTFKQNQLLKFEALQLGRDFFGTVEDVFNFRKFVSNQSDPFNFIADCFYDEPSLVEPGVIQNYLAFSSYQLDFCAEAAELLSFSDLQLRKMFMESNWAGSRAAAVSSTVLVGLSSTANAISHSGFLYPAFPGIISLNNQQKAFTETLMGMETGYALLNTADQAEFAEFALRIAQSEDEQGNAEEAREICSLCSETFFTDIQKYENFSFLSKAMKKNGKEWEGFGSLQQIKKKPKKAKQEESDDASLYEVD